MSELSEKILHLRDSGMSYKQIQKELNCSKGTIAYYCGVGQKVKAGMRAKQTKAKRRELVAQMKKVPCADCNGIFPPECMDFDHIEDNKMGDIGTMINVATWQAVLDEIAKCEIICANCHRTRTKNRAVGMIYQRRS